MEGGYQNFKEDKGNVACGVQAGTNMGVSAVAYYTWTKRCPTQKDMEYLTQAEALQFYKWYWNFYNIDGINNQVIAELVMNNTMGAPKRAAEAEQRALQRLGYDVAEDGARGPITLAALNDAAQKNMPRLYNTIREEWVNYLLSLNNKKFEDGWMYRMNRFYPVMAGAEAVPPPPKSQMAGGGIIGIMLLIGIFIATKK